MRCSSDHRYMNYDVATYKSTIVNSIQASDNIGSSDLFKDVLHNLESGRTYKRKCP